MPSGVACATDEFWNRVEVEMKCPIPTYLKNLLKLRGFDNALSVKSLTDDDIKSLETFARTKMKMFIPTGANYTDYYHMFSADPECFEILPGHVKLLKAIAQQIDLIHDWTPSGSSASRTCSEFNFSSQENGKQFDYSSNDDRGSFSEQSEKQSNDTPQIDAIETVQEPQDNDTPQTEVIETVKQDESQDTPQASVIDTVQRDEPFKAFIVDGLPEMFFIQLESTQSELDRIEALLGPASTWPVFNGTLVGQMCAALFDGSYYRGIILSSDETGATIHYIDYGNMATSTDLRKLPDDLRRHRHLAIACRLESTRETFSPQLVERFGNLSRDDPYEMKFVDKESHPAIVQVFVDGVLFGENAKTTKSMNVPESNGFQKQFDDIAESNKKFDEILDQMSELVVQNLPSTHRDGADEMPKFTEPTPLQDGDYVVIRYVESPTLFSVQLTKTIAEYDAMMDRLCDYCLSAPTIHNPRIGMACVAYYENDSEWYRAEIMDIGRGKALTRFVDYGVELTIEISQLKEIGNDFLLMPKQAIPCCILGFESLKATKTVTEKLEFLAERSSGERRKFRVSTHGRENGIPLVNLVDATDSPVLDLSMRLLQLSLPQEKFREYRQQLVEQNEPSAPSTLPIRSDCRVSPSLTAEGATLSSRDPPPVPDHVESITQDVDVQRLVGQTVMAKIASFKDQNSFQIVICGCDTIFEVSYHKATTGAKHFDKQLPKGATIPFRIEALLAGKLFFVTPLIDESSSTLICNFPFFSNHFEVYVIHWEDYNVAYVQSLAALGLVESLLDELFEFYDKSRLRGYDTIDDHQIFAPGTLCAVKSVDGNWYRAEITSDTDAEVNVRFLDYGNCELIPKSLVRRLDSKFLLTPALAVKVYLPLQKVYSDRETSVDEIIKLTAGTTVYLKVLDCWDRNWIVDMLIDNVTITTTIKQKNCCKSMAIDDLKKQIAHIETLHKVARLQAQTEREKRDVKTTPTVASNVHRDTATATSQNTQPASERNPQPDVNAEKTTKTNAYISHVDRPDQFYLQLSSISTALDQLRQEIQIVAPSLPPLEDFSIGTRCFVRYSLDNQWYRAAIIDSSSGITSIIFIDFGNTDTITDNTLMKAMNDKFDRIPPYAIPCSLTLEPKDRIDWSDEACELLRSMMDKELEFDYVLKGISNNFVNLYHEDHDIMQELIWGGHAIKLESIKSGTACHVSHINSMSDFYIQMESDIDTLRKVANYLLDVSKFDVMKTIKEGVVCTARDPHDKLWYRAKILSRKGNSTEVFFVDHGHSTLTNELRALPVPVANAPSLAKYCSLVKPRDIQQWSENAERSFAELTDDGSIFVVDVISPGKKSTVDLLVDNISILEDISAMGELLKAFIILGSPSKFYVQLESDSDQLDEMWYAMEKAFTWPPLSRSDVIVGEMCAALFDGSYYRAKILSVDQGGTLVHYVDYGNQSISNDLRKLPENLKQQRHLTICCCLDSKYRTVTSQMIERFEKLSRDDTYGIRFISKESSPAIVQLFVQGKKF